MKHLRSYYERELSTLRSYSKEFAAAYPAQAQQLGMAGGPEDDPHIARFIQATALSNARIAQLIDNNDVKVTEALLSVNYPHYLRPFPSVSIIHADTARTVATTSSVTTIARGAMLSAKSKEGPPCKFRTIYDLHLSPLTLSNAQFHPLIDIPISLPRPAAVNAAISIDIECAAGTIDLQRLSLEGIRCFIHAEPSLSALIRDTLFMRTQSAYLQLGDDFWIALDSIPLQAAGLADNEAMLEQDANAHPAYRLLMEYFAFPEKFNFFDINWAQLAPHVPEGCRRVTLHLGVCQPSSCDAAYKLAALSSSNFLLRCTPVINLFKRSACPIEVTHTTPDYALMPEGSPANAYDVHSIDSVTMTTIAPAGPLHTEVRPYYALRHGEAAAQRGYYYLLRRDSARTLARNGHDLRISLIDLHLDPLSVTNASLSIELTCTNRDLPTALRCGAPGGDLDMEHATDGMPIRLLRAPTPPYRLRTDAHWRLISHLSLNHCSLVQEGLGNLQEVLTLYDLTQSPVSQKQIGGITGLSHRPAIAWLRGDGHNTPIHGVEVRLLLDEEAFVGSSLHLFAQILDHFFGLYVHINSFSQLTIISHSSGKELIRCIPRNGAIQLL